MDTEVANIAESRRDLWVRHVNWWLLLIPPTALAVLATVSQWFHGEQTQVVLETVAPFLIGVAATIFVVRALVTRNPLHVIVAVLSVALLCREIHFVGTHRGIYVALGAIAVWAAAWGRKLAPAARRDRRFAGWLIASVFAYAFSQLVAKRVFGAKHLNIIPNEKTIHSTLEEGLETLAHLMFIATAVIGSWRRNRLAPTDDGREAGPP